MYVCGFQTADLAGSWTEHQTLVLIMQNHQCGLLRMALCFIMNVNVEDNTPVFGCPEVWPALHTPDQMRPSERREAAKLNKTEQTWSEVRWPTTAKTGLLCAGRKASVKTNRWKVAYIYFSYGGGRECLVGMGSKQVGGLQCLYMFRLPQSLIYLQKTCVFGFLGLKTDIKCKGNDFCTVLYVIYLWMLHHTVIQERYYGLLCVPPTVFGWAVDDMNKDCSADCTVHWSSIQLSGVECNYVATTF